MSTKAPKIGGPLAGVPKELLVDALAIYVRRNPDYLTKLKFMTKEMDQMISDTNVVNLYDWKRKRNAEYLL